MQGAEELGLELEGEIADLVEARAVGTVRVRPEDGALILGGKWGTNFMPRDVLAELDRRAGVVTCSVCGRRRGRTQHYC